MSLGKIFLVPTPIGNLKDITLRALETLENADEIGAEDTRQTLKLLNHFNIKKYLFSYHQHNEKSKCEEIISKVKDGKNIALVSDAGTPGISDPGSVIIKACINENIQFEVLPGATAFTTALIYSGLDTNKFSFRGFIPRETKDKKMLIDEIRDNQETLIFYESPHRLLETLSFLEQNFSNRNIAVCRELTKLHEQIFRGKIIESYNYFLENKPRGEFVLVIEGKSELEIKEEKEKKFEDLSIEDHLKLLINEGIDKKEAIKLVSKERGLPKKEVYKVSVKI